MKAVKNQSEPNRDSQYAVGSGRWPQLLSICLVLILIHVSVTVLGQPFDAPYEIPRFQAFLGTCKLQAPTSSTLATPAEIMAGFADDNFYVVGSDKVAFRQSGDSRRTELRDETNWTIGEGGVWLHGRIRVVEQTCDQVTLLQIHDDANVGNGPNKPLLRIYKHEAKSPVGHIWAAIKTDATGDNTTHVDLGLAPNDYFNVDIRIVNGHMIIVYEGEEQVNRDVSFWDFPSYWKAGVYLQDDGEATAYFDALYSGTVSVGGNSTPAVNISSPTQATNLTEGELVTISADAYDSDGSISQVEFFVDGTSVGVDDAPPYSVDWTVLVGGSSLSAVATDDAAASITSALVSVEGVGVLGGLQEQGVESAFSVYPNPSEGLFVLEVATQVRASFGAKVRSLDGRVLVIYDALSNERDSIVIDLAHYSPGLYLLEVVAEGDRSVYPLVKK